MSSRKRHRSGSKRKSRRKIHRQIQSRLVDSPKLTREYNPSELRADFNALGSYIRSTPPKSPLKRSRTGYAASNRFFQEKRLDTAGSDKSSSCNEKWKRNSREIVKKWKSYKRSHKSKKDLFGFMVYLNKAPAQFPPSIAGLIYKKFKAKNVFDPFAGWGDRCIAAMALNINYIGTDSNTSLRPAFEKMIRFYWPEAEEHNTATKISYVSKGQNTTDSKEVEIYFQPCQKISLENKNFDLVLSSPPFWKNGKLVEKYPKCEKDYETFMRTCMIPMMKKFQEKQITTCLHMPLDMYNDLKKEFGTCNSIIKFRSGKWGKSSETANNNIYCWNWN